ncbi:hypothetical protein CAPTEDRAFT_186033 [Capitella teleta]|uniref:Receptor protein-tyrosine kinase n=1 Tax=Capitella teleta TaxID=283909 RepID=R7V467_CAPTE|nr:hypothetical protein CAPTEDRAFT_186033 [Capitella teleta]|eukprot:ELU13359.1 hypothetical protein CAPTEDRAFT_186033 [Capitella teleta]
MASFHFLLLVSVWALHSGVSGQIKVFNSTPGLVKGHEGATVDLIWTTVFRIVSNADHEFHHTFPLDPYRLLRSVEGSTSTFNECRDRCEYLNGTNISGIRIQNITTADAKPKYICSLRDIHYGQSYDAVIYVYQKPNRAQLIGHPDDLREGDDLRLTCSSSSNSLPANNRSGVLMTYEWTLDDQYIDPDNPPERHFFEGLDHQVVLISGIAKEDSSSSYKCIGQEEGSRLQSKASEPYVVDGIQYAPGAASIQGNLAVMAGNEVTLTCSAKDLGNPQGIFKWKKPNGGTLSVKTLTIENLNVDDDEGDYECYVENDVAQGASVIHTLTVNSVPGVEQNLGSKKSVVNTDDSFSVSCAFRAKPAASVVWKREDESVLPLSIFSTSPTEETDGKFTITRSTLKWSGTDADVRRGQGGKMLCEANNGIGDPVKSHSMDLTIQHAPYDLNITPASSPVEVNNRDNLQDRVCSANCEPSCSYTWRFNREDGDIVVKSETLSLHSVNRGKHGSYYCEASNKINSPALGKFDLIVNYGPEILNFETSPRHGSIIESNSTTFSCVVDTRPRASIHISGPQGLSKSVKNGTELQHTIHNIGCVNSGTYICTSTNPKTGRQVEETIEIQVKCSPSVQEIFPEEKNYHVTKGASVYFFVKALSHPTPDFQWKQIFNNGSTIDLPSDDSGTWSNLSIANIQTEDYGSYSVSARNSIGQWKDIIFQLLPSSLEIQNFESSPKDGSIIESNSTTFSCTVDPRWTASIHISGPQGLSETVKNGTELQHTIHNIGCVNSGTYICTSTNPKTGQEVDETMDIQVKCSPSVQRVIPKRQIHYLTEGASVYFFVEALSHPPPDFQWKRIYSNGTTLNRSSDDSGNMSNLTISNISMEDLGNYTVSAHNEIGRWEDIKFELREIAEVGKSINLGLVVGVAVCLVLLAVLLIGAIFIFRRYRNPRNSAQREFAADYLEGQVEIVEQLKSITNIEVPLGFILQEGMRQPVFHNPVLLLSGHLKNYKLICDNFTPGSLEIYENSPRIQSDMQTLFVGISNGLAQLHQVGALAYGLNTESVFVHEENGRLIARLSSFSEASLVRQRDRLDFEMGERDVRRLAPETIDLLEHTCKSDVWVMAILFWEVISGCVPYKAYTDTKEVAAAIMSGLKLDKPAECTPEMHDVMMRCWMLNPENRPSASQVVQELLTIKSI